MVQLSLSSVNNNGLFAQHYLENRLPNMDEWKEPEGLEKAFEEIRELWEQEKDIVNNYNEAQLEDNFIKKIFSILNHSYGVQASVKENALRPDYGFFKSKKEKQEAHKQKEIDDFYKNSIAVGDAKQWGISLDKKTKYAGDKYDKKNPSWQIYMYLKETPANWGILTNGKKWRLYNEETSDRLDTYYEIDLPTILEKEDRKEALQEFKYFYLFFRQKAFTPTKKSFLDKVFEQSEKYSQRIGDNLEESVYEALLYMARGYYNNNENKLKPKVLRANKKSYSELEEKNKLNQRIEKIHENSLIFLYRLLFLFYAESKDKLGREVPPKYRFDEWVDGIIEEIDNNEVNPKGGLHNNSLDAIFRLLKEGTEGLGIEDKFFVPAYNGTLFDSEEHPFLKNKNIYDGYVAEVVDLLARNPLKDEPGKGRVDYSDLSIRHIGGIYEGLLEYNLEIAEKDIVAIKGEWKPIKELDHNYDYYHNKYDNDKKHNVELDLAKEGEIYLTTNKGERKATGSYYTPEYIVQYIVENTVKPKVEEKLEGLETDKEKREAILDINVLDPAMGSGHFLVDALDLLANKLVKYAPEDVDEKEIDWAKRKVVRNCLYGVDVNPLATELAKVSLWLQTMTEDKPLPFLEHHLRTGNSLIGADLEDLETHPETDKEKQDQKQESEPEPEPEKDSQVHLLDIVGESEEDNGESIEEKIDEILKKQRDIMKTTENRPDDIKKEKKKYQRFRNNDLLLKLKMLADIHTSHYFENKYTKDQYKELKNSLMDKEWKELAEEKWIKEYSDNLPKKYKKEDNSVNEKQFFHWELEFPEIFLKEQNGFDAVVGNPPWVSFGLRDVGEIPDNLENYLRKNYPNSAQYKLSTYAIFIDRSLSLCANKGFQSFIVPDSYLLGQYFEKIRKRILSTTSIREITLILEDFWEEATTGRNTVYCFKKIKKPNKSMDIKMAETMKEFKENERKGTKYSQEFFENRPLHRFHLFFKDPQKSFVETVEKESNKVINDDLDINTGMRSRTKQKDIKAKEKKGKKWKKGITSSGQVLPYSVVYQGDYLHAKKEKLFHGGWDPNVVEQEEKIMIRQTGDRIIAGYDDQQLYHLNNTHSAVLREGKNLPNMFYVSYLNSALLFSYYTLTTLEYGRTMAQTDIETLEKLPLKTPKTTKELRGERKDKIENINFSDLDLEETEVPSALSILGFKRKDLTENRRKINLNIQDYLGNYSNGKILSELFNPVTGISNKTITDTAADREKLKIGSVEFEEKNNDLILKASARYKPENEEEFNDLDRWGYTETDLFPAMRFSVDEKLETLIKEFVPVAVDEAGGFAGFRENASKTNSIIDRLEKLTLPKLKDVEKGLEKFIENKEKAEQLEKEIQETDNQIDAIVFDLYDLTADEVETVLESLDTDEKVKEDILRKFRNFN